MYLTQCASEPLDAFRDPIVATVFLQSGLPVGYLAAPLALLAVASSTTPKEALCGEAVEVKNRSSAYSASSSFFSSSSFPFRRLFKSRLIQVQ